MDNTRLAGFNLGSKPGDIGALAGVKSGDATEIRQVRFNLTYSNAGIRTDNLYALVPALGQATGAGSIAKNGIPLTISGTTSNPVFSANRKGVTTSLVQDQATSLLSGKISKSTKSNQDPMGALTGILGKKK